MMAIKRCMGDTQRLIFRNYLESGGGKDFFGP